MKEHNNLSESHNFSSSFKNHSKGVQFFSKENKVKSISFTPSPHKVFINPIDNFTGKALEIEAFEIFENFGEELDKHASPHFVKKEKSKFSLTNKEVNPFSRTNSTSTQPNSFKENEMRKRSSLSGKKSLDFNNNVGATGSLSLKMPNFVKNCDDLIGIITNTNKAKEQSKTPVGKESNVKTSVFKLKEMTDEDNNDEDDEYFVLSVIKDKPKSSKNVLEFQPNNEKGGLISLQSTMKPEKSNESKIN